MKKTMCKEINPISYLPSFMQDVIEFQEITNTEKIELENVQDAKIDVLSNQFIEDSTEYGVERWEKILNIVPTTSENLANRKNNILTAIQRNVPYTMRTLKSILATSCGENGYTINYNSERFILKIEVSVVTDNHFNDIYKLLNNIIPANIIIDLSISNEALTEDGEYLLTESNENIYF